MAGELEVSYCDYLSLSRLSVAAMSQADIRQELESFGVDVKSAVVLEKR